jgi:hypothetical protein
MADYININGNNIPIRASDPSNPIEGEVWYNLTTNALKGQAFQAAAWSSSGNMNYSMGDGGMSRQGGKSAALAWQGGPSPVTSLNKTESYNGSTWTSESTTPYPASGVGSFGAATSAVGAGGQPGGGGVTTTIEWNGSSWGSGGSLPYANLYQFGGAGPGTDGILVGGYSQPPPNQATNDVKVYNGSTWSTDPATCPFAFYAGTHYGAGSSDCNVLGGYSSPPPAKQNNHANYNGTAFTTLTAYPTVTAASGAFGTTSDAYVYGGNPSLSAGNNWDGTSWTASTSYPSGIEAMYNCGATVNDGVSSGGNTPSYTNNTFEYQAAAAATVTISSS